jgi:hypothetical protein
VLYEIELIIMKKYTLLIIVFVLLIFAFVLVYWVNIAGISQQANKNEIIKGKEFCSQFSGSAGYMEGETKAKECMEANCQVINKKEFSSSRKTKFCDGSTGECEEIDIVLPDSGGYTFECIPKEN